MSRREVDVLALGWRWGRWAVLAHCHRRGALRVFLLERIVEVRVGRRRVRPRPLAGIDPAEFALADLQAPEVGLAVRRTLDLPSPLARLAPVLFPGAPLEPGPWGLRVHLTATDRAALGSMAASLGLAVG